MKNLDQFTSDAELLTYLDCGPDKRLELWCWGNEHGVRIPNGIALISKENERMRIPELPLGLTVTNPTPEECDQFLANAIVVFGPWLRERGLIREVGQSADRFSLLTFVRIYKGGHSMATNSNPHEYLAFLAAILRTHQVEAS